MKLDPKIAAELARLNQRAGELSKQIEDTNRFLRDTLALKTDFVGVIARSDELHKLTTKLLFVAGKIEALRSTPYLEEP